MDHSDISEEKRKEFIRISLKEIDRANDIIVSYLTFAKPTPEENEIMNIKQELETTINIITSLANMNSIEMQTHIHNCHMFGQVQLIKQSLLNILKNCIEAMPNGGSLFIGTKEVNEHVVIEIKDNGIGMTKDQISRIGEPYFTTKGREGTGLGMMAAIKIIESMNGKLEVTSEVNEGTTFKIYFPRVIEEKEAAATSE